MDFEQIGMRIKACRKQKHLTQEKLAECLDVSSHYIYELERGVKTMSLYTLNDLSTCLEVSSDYLLYGKDNTDSNPIPEDALSVMKMSLSRCLQLANQSCPVRRSLFLAPMDGEMVSGCATGMRPAAMTAL